MALTVTVLCPGGRRQTIKVTPMTSLQEVLERTCTAQRLDAQSFSLLHHSRLLDLSSTVRFSGLPNRAQLELTEAADRSSTESDVTLAVQTSDGQRKVGVFASATSLWQVLSALDLLPADDVSAASKTPDRVVICVYAGREVVGRDALSKTTLRRLGLLSGKAVIRLMIRDSSHVAGTQAHVSAPLSKPTVDVQQSITEPESATVQKSQTAIECPSLDVDMESNSYVTELDTSDLSVRSGASKPAADVKDGVSLPSNSAVGTVHDSHSNYSGSSNVHSAAGLASSNLSLAVDEQTPDEHPSVQCVVDADASSEPLVTYLDDSRTVVFSMDDAATCQGSPEELPDHIFEVTIDDVRSRQRALREHLARLQEAPLMTAQLRETQTQADQLCRLSKYRQCVVRVQFADRLVLQLVCRSTDTVQTLLDMVRGHLAVADVPFGLAMAAPPPSRILQAGERLFEAGCVPAARLHIVADGQSQSCQATLSGFARQKLSSPAAADWVLRSLQRSSSACPDEQSQSPAARARRPRTVQSSNTPAWFNMVKRH